MVVWYFPTWNITLLLNKKKKKKKPIKFAAQKYIGQIALSPSLKKSDLSEMRVSLFKTKDFIWLANSLSLSLSFLGEIA